MAEETIVPPPLVDTGTGWRGVPPEETWARISGDLRRFGVARVARLTELDVLGLPVYAGVRPMARTLSVSAGKGFTDVAARVSAAMESLEVAIAEQWTPVRVTQGSDRGVRTGYCLNELAHEPDAAPFLDPQREVAWCPATRILDGDQDLVPVDVVGLGRHRETRAWCTPGLSVTSNGLASGNDMTEAALHGLLEVIERDALTQIPGTPNAELRSVDLPPGNPNGGPVEQLLAAFERAGIGVECILLDGIAGTTTVACTLDDPGFPVVTAGSGCHLDARLALVRALTEAAQSRLSFISGGREDIPSSSYDRRHVFAPSDRSRRPAEPLPPPGPAPSSLAETLTEVATRVEWATGRQPMLVDLTPPQCEFTVVRVIAPGLRFTAERQVLASLGAPR